MSNDEKLLSVEEIEALDPAFIDSVTGDRIIATLKWYRKDRRFLMRMYENQCVEKMALWLAAQQGEMSTAAEWICNGVDDLIDDQLLRDDWAHDWRAYWAYHGHNYSEKVRRDLCDICERPATITGVSMRACSERHRKAIDGKLPDEVCRLCNEMTACAHDLAGSPVCADCWPGEKLLADARAAWAAKWSDDG